MTELCEEAHGGGADVDEEDASLAAPLCILHVPSVYVSTRERDYTYCGSSASIRSLALTILLWM